MAGNSIPFATGFTIRLVFLRCPSFAHVHSERKAVKERDDEILEQLRDDEGAYQAPSDPPDTTKIGEVTQRCFNHLAKWEGFNMISPFLKDGWWNHGLQIIPQVLQFFFPHLVLIFGPLWIHCSSTANLRVGLGKNGWIPCSSS